MMFDSAPNFLIFLQKSLFDVFDLVLEHRKLPVKLSNFLIMMQYMQMISMIFNSSNPDLETTLLKDYLFLGDYFLIFLGLSKSPYFAISLFVTIVITILILSLIFGFLYIHVYKDPDDIFQKDFSNVLAFLYDCLNHIFLIPCFGVLILNMTCNSYECGTIEHIIMSIWSVLLIVVIIFLEFLYVFCFFNFTFRIVDGFSRNPSQRPFLSFLLKILLITFSLVVDLRNNYSILLIAHVVYGWILFQETLTNYPFHDKNVSKCYGIFVSAYFCFNISLFFVSVVSFDFFKENILVIVFLGAFLFVKLFLTLRNYTIKGLMISELDEIKSDIHLDLKVRLFNQLLQTIHIKKHELLLASLLKIHSDKCEDLDCICRRRAELYDPFLNLYGDQNLQFHKDDVFVKHYLIKMIKEGIAKFSDSKLLYLDFIFYNFESLKIYAPIYCFIKYFQQKYPNNLHFSYQFCIHRLLAQMERFLIKKNFQAGLNDRLMIDNVKKFDKGITSLKTKLTKCLEDYTEIWNTLNQNMPDLGILLKTCNHCIQNNNEVLKQYEMLVSLNDQSQKLKNFMEIYCLYISYDELLWGRVEKDIKMPQHMEIGDSLHQDLEYLLHKYNMFDENVGTIVISPNFENMGQILWVSSNIPKIFHYEMNQFRTMNVSTLMPEVIGKCHEKILQTFYLTSKEVAINNFRHLWALNKESFCFSVNILVKVVPMKDDFEIIGLIHKLNEGDYILTNNEGNLLNLGQKLSEIMEMSPQTLSQMKINFQLLAPRLTQYYKRIFIEDNDLPDTNNIIKKTEISLNTASNHNAYNNSVPRKGSESMKNSKKTKEQNANFINKNRNFATKQHKQIRFYIFIPEDLDTLTKFQQEEIQKSEAKFDLQKAKERVFKDIKLLIQLRKCFGSSLKKTFSKIDLKKVKKVLRVKASLQHLKFCNGDINFVAIKVLYIEVKKPDLISFEKRNQQSKYIKLFLKDMKKIEDQVNLLNTTQKAMEEQENRDENNEIDLNRTPKEQSANERIKGMLNLFRKKGPNALVTPKKEQPKFEKEGTLSRQLSNIHTSQNNSTNEPNKTSKKRFLEDGSNIGNSPEVAKKPTNALKNMLKRIKEIPMNQNPKQTSPTKQNEEKKTPENSPSPIFSRLLKNKKPQNNEKTPEEIPKKEISSIVINEDILPVERDSKKKLSSIANISNISNNNNNNMNSMTNSAMNNNFSREPNKKPSIINNNDSKKPPPFGSQSSLHDRKPGNKNPLSILHQIEENVKHSTLKEEVSDLDSSPEKDKKRENSKSWTSKFRNILIKKGMFEKNKQPTVAKPTLTGKKPAFFGVSKGNTGLFSGLRGLLGNKKPVSSKISNDGDSAATSRSMKSEILREDSDFSSNSEERSAELNILLKSENSSNKKEEQKRDLRDRMEKMRLLEDQEQVNSVASSAFSSVAQNSLKRIKDNLKKQKTSLLLRISNLLAFVCCIIVCSLSLSQYLEAQSKIANLFKVLQEINSISFYNENFLKIINYYEVRRTNSLGFYQWNVGWDAEEKNSVKKALEIMTKLSNNDIVQDMTTDNAENKQNNYVFSIYKVNLQVYGVENVINMNFLDFFRMFVVAINATVDLDTTAFSTKSIEQNDYLSFIFDNEAIIGEIININNEFIHNQLVSANYDLKMSFLYIWIATFILLLLSFIVIFPIIYQSKSRIFNTLALFTKIPLRDVEYYNNHYKKIMLNLARIEESSELLRTIQSETEENQKNLITLKRNDGNSFIRTRNYKGINIDKFTYVSKVIILFMVIYGLILAKDLKLFIFIWDQDDLQGLYSKQHEVLPKTYQNLIIYKQTYINNLQNFNISNNNFNFSELYAGTLVTDLFEKYSKLHYDFKNFYQDLMTMSLCDFLQNNVEKCVYFTADYCNRQLSEVDLATTYAFDEIWGSCPSILPKTENGLVNILLENNNFIKDQLNLIKNQTQFINNNKTEMTLEFFRNDFERLNYFYMNYVLILMRKWYYISYEANLSEANTQLTLNKQLLILFLVLAGLLIFVGWWREYNKLKSDSKWVNGFIILLPLHLIKENQHLKVFLKRKIKITNLDN